MVSAFDGRISDQDELRDPGKHQPSSTTMTSDPALEKTLNKGSTEKVDAEAAGEDAEGGNSSNSRPRTPVVTGPIIELRGREVIFAIGVFFLFAVVVGLVVVLASHKVKGGGGDDDASTNSSNSSQGEFHGGDEGSTESGSFQCPPARDPSAAWVLTAASLLQNMNRSVDPCDDFWQYSCGGWLDRAEIPASMESVGVDGELDQRIRRDIRTILEGRLRRGGARSSERKFKDLYYTCMDTGAIEREGRKPFLDIVNQFGGWSFMPDWNIADKSGRWSVLRALSEVHFTYDVEAFFSVAVGKDDKNSSINVLQFDQGGLSLLKRNDYFRNGGNSSTIVAYKRYMATVARLFGATNQVSQQFAESTFKMEHDLATLHATEHSDERRDTESMYNKLTTKALQKFAPRINWTLFLRSAFPKVTEDTVVLVTNITYMTNVSHLISNSKESDVSNYLLWRLMSTFASPLLSEPFRDAHNEFKKPSRDSPTDPASRAKTRHSYCHKVVSEWFGNALSSEYVRSKNFIDIEREILDLIASIKAIFRQTLQKSDWMDELTRENALEKLDAMQERVGFPHFILNITELDDYYDGFEVQRNASFFSNILNGLLHQKQKKLDALQLNVQTEDWSMNPLDVNAFYSMAENIVGFTVGLLQKPFYDKNAPNYVNYASLGSTIAHEIIHGYDESGALYDSEGNLRQWWTNETMDLFTNRTKCVQNYYDSLFVDDIQVNGELTLNENLADIGGLRHAYEAYKTWERTHSVEDQLPGLKLTNDKVFFVAFAQNWCKSRRKESVRKFMSHSLHAIEEIRVRGTVSQIQDFSDVFGCSPGAAMNPPQKCKVW